MNEKPEVRVYMTRNFRKDLFIRLRKLAVERDETIEQTLNVVVEAGLKVVEEIQR